MKYDIIIATNGETELSEKCFHSVRHNSIDWRIIWIDNDRYPAPELIDDLSNNVTYVRPPENIGYTKAMNVGLALSTAPFVVLLNDDTEVTDGWLEGLEEGFLFSRRVAAVAPITNNQRQGQGRKTPNQGIFEIIPKEIKAGWGIDVQLSSFCLMLSREAIVEIGYLDERFSPGFGDDDDWLYRAHLKNWRLILQTDVLVKHVGSATWSTEKRAELQSRNVQLLKKKYGG
jgi:GT2 family glycosyltransferase